MWLLRLPTLSEFETIFLEQDKLLVVLPENHHLAQKKKVSVSDLCNEPFMLLEKVQNQKYQKYLKKAV